MDGPTLGLAHFWAQADGVTRAVALVLLGMSMVSWILILYKLTLWRHLRGGLNAALALFWQAPTLEAGTAQLRAADGSGLTALLAEAAQNASAENAGIGAQSALADRLMRALRLALRTATQRLDVGQTWLASVGATAPFIGLFGTVWGIYHALVGIASAGEVSIDRVAGPVGEALIMTALGLAVAIPAVLAYNAYARLARAVVADLDGFARDLHAHCQLPR